MLGTVASEYVTIFHEMSQKCQEEDKIVLSYA